MYEKLYADVCACCTPMCVRVRVCVRGGVYMRLCDTQPISLPHYSKVKHSTRTTIDISNAKKDDAITRDNTSSYDNANSSCNCDVAMRRHTGIATHRHAALTTLAPHWHHGTTAH